MHIRAHQVANIGHFINKRDLGGQECIGGVFYHLRGFHVRNDNGRFDEVEGGIEVFHDGIGLFTFRSYDHPIWSHKVLYGWTLPEKFGIGDHIKGYILHLVPLNNLPNLFSCPHRNGTFCGDDFVPFH